MYITFNPPAIWREDLQTCRLTFSRWLTMDPLAEKYYSISPYAFSLNNPVNFVDPDGRDVYRFDDETGDMILHQQTNDDFDQIGRFQYDRKTDTYTLRTNRNGEARTRMDNIEKGILSDGMNFMTNANVWETGALGQPTVEGFQDFAIQFGDMIGREVAGFYFSNNGQDNVSYIHMGKYENNKRNQSFSTPSIFSMRSDLHGRISPHTAWHTHPSDALDSDRLRPSVQDYNFKAGQQQAHGIKHFIILTGGHSPIPY